MTIRKFTNVTGFEDGVLYVLYNDETQEVTNVVCDAVPFKSEVFLKYADKFVAEGSWEEHSYEAQLTQREEVLVTALRHIATGSTSGNYLDYQHFAREALKQLGL